MVFGPKLCTVFENHRKSRIFNSEVRYVLSGQKFIKNAKNGPNWLIFENLVLLRAK